MIAEKVSETPVQSLDEAIEVLAQVAKRGENNVTEVVEEKREEINAILNLRKPLLILALVIGGLTVATLFLSKRKAHYVR